MATTIVALDKNWIFSQLGGGQGTKDGEWIPVSHFPTTVHVELLKLGRIPDPVSTDLSQLLHPFDRVPSHTFAVRRSS